MTELLVCGLESASSQCNVLKMMPPMVSMKLASYEMRPTVEEHLVSKSIREGAQFSLQNKT